MKNARKILGGPSWVRERFLVLLTIMIWLPGSGCQPAVIGEPRFPVEGRVLINGRPEANVSVQFWHQDPSIAGNDRYPTGMTDAEGRFRLSSYARHDGAVSGDYVVTFAWMSSTDVDAVDLLQGEWGDPERSIHRAQVTPEPSGNRLNDFELQVSEKHLP